MITNPYEPSPASLAEHAVQPVPGLLRSHQKWLAAVWALAGGSIAFFVVLFLVDVALSATERTVLWQFFLVDGIAGTYALACLYFAYALWRSSRRCWGIGMTVSVIAGLFLAVNCAMQLAASLLRPSAYSISIVLASALGVWICILSIKISNRLRQSAYLHPTTKST